MTGVLKIFLQRPTIALLFHRISHVTHCVYILTKALLLFTLLLKMAYVELMVGEKEVCTCVIYIAKSNNGLMGMTKSHKLIKIMHMCRRWMVEMEYSSMDLSPFIWIT